ncbi:MAG: hypothetical protein ACRDD1_04095 [Planctomycetia bacterium]
MMYFVSPAHAADWLAEVAGRDQFSRASILADPAVRASAYQSAAKRFHPDAGGKTEDVQRLQAAKRLLDESNS